MIHIKLDTPIKDNGKWIDEIIVETPITAKHILYATRRCGKSREPGLVAELFFESVLGLSRGGVEKLTLEDYAKVMEAIGPFLASFEGRNVYSRHGLEQ